MAENDSVKDNLAIEQKKEYEEQVLETIKELKTGETTTIGGMEITNYGGQATIKLEGIDITFGIVDNNGNFTYSRENFVEVKKVLEEEGITLEELGLPDIEEWIDLEEPQIEENGRDERGLSKDMKEKDKPEREEPEKPEKEDKEEETKEITKAGIKWDPSWIEIRSDRETDEFRTFSTMLRKEYPKHMQGAKRFFIAPNPKDANDYNLYVTDKQKNVINEIPLEHTEGKNPISEEVITYAKDGKNAKTQIPIQMLKIGKSHNNAMIMIYNGKINHTEVHIGVRSQGDNYQSHSISSSRSQNNFMDATEDVKYATSSSGSERYDGDREKRVYETLANLEKQGVPDEINPAKDNNGIEVIEVENYKDFTAAYADILMNKYDISKECAANVAVRVLDDGEKFDKAMEQGILEEEKIKESKGTIPPGSAEHIASEKTKRILSGDGDTMGDDVENDEKTPDENPRRRGH